VASASDDTRVVLWEAYAPPKAVYPLSQQRGPHEPSSAGDGRPVSAAALRTSDYAPSGKLPPVCNSADPKLFVTAGEAAAGSGSAWQPARHQAHVQCGATTRSATASGRGSAGA